MKLGRYLPHYIIFLFLVTLVLRLVLVGYYNNNLGGIELNVVYGVQRLLLGQPLYQDPCSGSFGAIQYTPLYYYVAAAAAKACGIRALQVQEVFELCRVLALLCNLLTVAVCGSIIRSFHFGWRQSVVAAMPVVIILTSHYYTRGDSLHLLLFVASVWALLRYSRAPRAGYLILAGLASAACLTTKQSGLLGIGIIGASLVLVHRNYVAAAGYGVVTALAAVVAAWLCLNGSSPLLLYQNAWLGLKNGYDASFLTDMFVSQYFLDFVPCYFLAAGMAYWAFRRQQQVAVRVLMLGCVLSWLFAVLTGLKKGSSNNYFTEFLLLLLLALPVFVRAARAQGLIVRGLGRTMRVARLATVALLLLITSKTVGFFSAVCIEKGFKNYKTEYSNEQQLYAYFQDTLHLHAPQKIFFTERRFLDNLFIGYTVLPTRDVSSLVYMADSTTYDYTRFRSGMNTGMIQYVVTGADRDNINICHDSLPFVWFDTMRYHLVGRVAGYCIYSYSGGR